MWKLTLNLVHAVFNRSMGVFFKAVDTVNYISILFYSFCFKSFVLPEAVSSTLFISKIKSKQEVHFSFCNRKVPVRYLVLWIMCCETRIHWLFKARRK